MKDRLTPGAIAGIIGAIIQIIYGRTVVWSGLSSYAFTDFGEILILGTDRKGLLPFFIGSITHIVLGAMMGIVLSYVIKYTSSRFYLFKGIGVGLAIYVFAFASGVYFKMPIISKAPISFALTVLIGSALYGLVTAYALKKITNNFRQYFAEDNQSQRKQRVFKFFLQPARKIEKEGKKVKFIKPKKI